MARIGEVEVSSELFKFGANRQFDAKIVGTRVVNPNIVESNENSSLYFQLGQQNLQPHYNLRNCMGVESCSLALPL